MNRREWIERFVVELEMLGAVLSAVELFAMAKQLWLSSRDIVPEVAARELYGDR